MRHLSRPSSLLLIVIFALISQKAKPDTSSGLSHSKIHSAPEAPLPSSNSENETTKVKTNEPDASFVQLLVSKRWKELSEGKAKLGDMSSFENIFKIVSSGKNEEQTRALKDSGYRVYRSVDEIVEQDIVIAKSIAQMLVSSGYLSPEKSASTAGALFNLEGQKQIIKKRRELLVSLKEFQNEEPEGNRHLNKYDKQIELLDQLMARILILEEGPIFEEEHRKNIFLQNIHQLHKSMKTKRD